LLDVYHLSSSGEYFLEQISYLGKRAS